MRLGTKILLLTLAITLALAGLIVWVVTRDLTAHETDRAQSDIRRAVSDYFGRIESLHGEDIRLVTLLMEDPQNLARLEALDASDDERRASTSSCSSRTSSNGPVRRPPGRDRRGAHDRAGRGRGRGAGVSRPAERRGIPLLTFAPGEPKLGDALSSDTIDWPYESLLTDDADARGGTCGSTGGSTSRSASRCASRSRTCRRTRTSSATESTTAGPRRCWASRRRCRHADAAAAAAAATRRGRGRHQEETPLHAWFVVEGEVVVRGSSSPAAAAGDGHDHDGDGRDDHAGGGRGRGRDPAPGRRGGVRRPPADRVRAPAASGSSARPSRSPLPRRPARRDRRRQLAHPRARAAPPPPGDDRVGDGRRRRRRGGRVPLRVQPDRPPDRRRSSTARDASPRASSTQPDQGRPPRRARPARPKLQRDGRRVAAARPGQEHVRQVRRPEGRRGLPRPTPNALMPGGEKRVQTVLFSDLMGFTALAERLDADDLVPLLNGYLGDAANVVTGTRGIVDKFIGDAVVAFWGPPITARRRARRRWRASRRCGSSAASAGSTPSATGSACRRWACASASRPARCSSGIIGSSNKYSYTVMGDDVNLGVARGGPEQAVRHEHPRLTARTAARRSAAVITRRIDRVRVVGPGGAGRVVRGARRRGGGRANRRGPSCCGARRTPRPCRRYERRDWPAAGRRVPSGWPASGRRTAPRGRWPSGATRSSRLTPAPTGTACGSRRRSSASGACPSGRIR